MPEAYPNSRRLEVSTIIGTEHGFFRGRDASGLILYRLEDDIRPASKKNPRNRFLRADDFRVKWAK